MTIDEYRNLLIAELSKHVSEQAAEMVCRQARDIIEGALDAGIDPEHCCRCILSDEKVTLRRNRDIFRRIEELRSEGKNDAEVAMYILAEGYSFSHKEASAGIKVYDKLKQKRGKRDGN